MHALSPLPKAELIIGIDTGVETGFATYQRSTKRLGLVQTLKIHEAMAIIRQHVDLDDRIFVRVEDPRQATFGRKLEGFKLRGAGSVMRDAKIWEDYLTDLQVPFEMVRPRKSLTKLSAQVFGQITGYWQPTSEHGRDAAMLVYAY
jgi:hypothetical protein